MDSVCPVFVHHVVSIVQTLNLILIVVIVKSVILTQSSPASS